MLTKTGKTHYQDSYYRFSKIHRKIEEKLTRLFDNTLTELRCEPPDITSARQFFEEHEKEITTHVGEKENIPDDNDLRLLVCLDKEGWDGKYILSNDAHFTDYRKEIEQKSDYDVYIPPRDNVQRAMIEWKWIT